MEQVVVLLAVLKVMVPVPRPDLFTVSAKVLRSNLAVDVQVAALFTVMLQTVAVELLHPDQPAAIDCEFGVDVSVHVPTGTVLVQGRVEQLNC